MNPDDTQQLAELHRLFLSAPISWNSRLLVFLVSFALVAIVLALVKRRALREEHTPVWLFASLFIATLSIWQQALMELTQAIGAWTHASTLFFFTLLFLVAVCLNHAVRLSTLTLQVKNLCQEVALLKEQLEQTPGRQTLRNDSETESV